MIIQHNTRELNLLARLMRAEAVGEGDLGMLMVGNVVANRIIGNCLDFVNIRTVEDAINQSPGGFNGKDSPLFFSAPTAKEKSLAERVLRGEYYYPATNALWFYAPKTGEICLANWYGQRNTGRYKSHCFYAPNPDVCKNIY